MNDDNQVQSYRIPDNFIDGGRVLNGMFRTRYFIEAATMAIVIAVFLWCVLPFPALNKISFVILGAGPVFVLGIHGISDQPVSAFLLSILRFNKRKRVMMYSPALNIDRIRLGEVVVRERTNADILRDRLAAIRHRSDEQAENNQIEVEGVDFLYAADPTLAALNAAAKKMATEDSLHFRSTTQGGFGGLEFNPEKTDVEKTKGRKLS